MKQDFKTGTAKRYLATHQMIQWDAQQTLQIRTLNFPECKWWRQKLRPIALRIVWTMYWQTSPKNSMRRIRRHWLLLRLMCPPPVMSKNHWISSQKIPKHLKNMPKPSIYVNYSELTKKKWINLLYLQKESPFQFRLGTPILLLEQPFQYEIFSL